MSRNISVLIIGSGAREDGLSRAYEKSCKVQRIIVSPGNDFIGYKREKEVIIDKDSSLKNPESILKIAEKYRPDLIDVAQDNALASGAADLLKKYGFQVFGPEKEIARIEWDKKWSRKFMRKYDIPHPQFRYFDSERDGISYVKRLYKVEKEKLLYVKATGLCSGKGALKSTNLEEAINNIKRMKTFPDGSGKVFLVEDGLVGEEFSSQVISDGGNYHILKSAQDNKMSLNFDEGDQTGGMGAISPATVTDLISDKIEEQQISKAINGMNAEGCPYVGILYLGGILVNGKPLTIEYNARWGDPECQVVLPSIKTDYLDVITACLDGRLDKIKIEQDNKTRFCIVGASRGYPNDYSESTGKRIYGLEEVMEMENITLLGAGIEIKNEKFYTNGGRLFSLVAEGENILDAKRKAYSAMPYINIEGNNLHYRTEIGHRDVERSLKESK